MTPRRGLKVVTRLPARHRAENSTTPRRVPMRSMTIPPTSTITRLGTLTMAWSRPMWALLKPSWVESTLAKGPMQSYR